MKFTTIEAYSISTTCEKSGDVPFVEDPKRKPKNLGERSGENEAIAKRAEHEVGTNNIKSVKCCEVFFSRIIEQVTSLNENSWGVVYEELSGRKR